jgi:outer membrane protein assembly factor BamB
VVLVLWAPSLARADWPTYRSDDARPGVDTSSVGSLPFAPSWTSPDLGGATWGRPLVHDGLVIVATQVIVGYGGNDGDCGTYHGWLVSIPETGGPLRSFEVDESGSQGAIWGAGNAPPVDSAGDVWVATGNGNSTSFDDQESVLKLDPSMNLLDHWAPSDWQSLDSSDADIGSSAPVLLPGGLVFEIGKQGLGYVLSAANLGGTGWQAPSSANGPPIVAGGLVWATDWNNARLHGLNPRPGSLW